MFVVICYDVPDDRRRTKIMKALKDYGQHVQYSVFECDLKHADYQRLQQRLKKLCNPRQDNIRFYILSEEDVKKRRVWGVERTEMEVLPWYLVGPGKE
jgi:CRISPR-associated protein Cas2